MNLRESLLADRDEIDKQIAIIDRVGEDIFPLGTLALFSGQRIEDKWYYIKTGEEAWRSLNPTRNAPTKELREWILETEESSVGYFEIYILNPAATPFYTSISS